MKEMEHQELAETKAHFQKILSETQIQFQENNQKSWEYKAPAEIFIWEIGGFCQTPKNPTDNSDHPSVTNSGDGREDHTYTDPEYDQDDESIIQNLHESSQSIPRHLHTLQMCRS